MSHQTDRLLRIMARLRDPKAGCEWDRAQTFSTIAPYTIEEAYEVADAIERADMDELRGELGDLLFQVVFHARMAEESGDFSYEDVARDISNKMEARHPHIFGDAEAHTAEEVKANWEDIKQKERGDSSSRLSSIPRDLPALAYAQLLQDRASLAGFDWDRLEGVLQKVEEEIRELEEAESQEEKESEFGDILFSLVNTGRWMSIQVEESLRRSNQRFSRRFTDMESLCKERSIAFADLSLEDKEALWQEAKKRGG